MSGLKEVTSHDQRRSSSSPAAGQPASHAGTWSTRPNQPDARKAAHPPRLTGYPLLRCGPRPQQHPMSTQWSGFSCGSAARAGVTLRAVGPRRPLRRYARAHSSEIRGSVRAMIIMLLPLQDRRLTPWGPVLIRHIGSWPAAPVRPWRMRWSTPLGSGSETSRSRSGPGGRRGEQRLEQAHRIPASMTPRAPVST